MRFDKLSNYKNGWLVGDFQPSIFESKDNDIGILQVKKNSLGDSHFHKNHIEYNIIVAGEVEINGNILTVGDIFIYEPFDKSELLFHENTTLVVIKNPATKNDKFYN
jgi:hypothetical protein